MPMRKTETRSKTANSGITMGIHLMKLSPSRSGSSLAGLAGLARCWPRPTRTCCLDAGRCRAAEAFCVRISTMVVTSSLALEP